MTLQAVLRQGEQILKQASVPEAECNAWYLFSHCFSLKKSEYFLYQDQEADEICLENYYKCLQVRCDRVPLEYITHDTEFMGLPFSVEEGVLIPRQDTECLVEEVLKVCEGRDVLDLCTGSGCIGVSLAVLGHCRRITMSDISESALQLAEKNLKINQTLDMTAEINVVKSNLFEQLEGKYDIIVSNPPYIKKDVIDTLMPEVRDHEPITALCGGADGLTFYRSIIEKSEMYLKKNGMLFFEIGYDQGEPVAVLMNKAGYTGVCIKKDLAGLDRIVCGQIGGQSV